MKGDQQKRIVWILFFIFLSVLFPFKMQADTFYGEPKTGLIEIKDFAHPVFLYVPETLKPGRKYPLIIAVPKMGGDPAESVEYWKRLASRQSFIVLSPTLKRLEDVPYDYDKWFFQVKAFISTMYPINKEKIFLVGMDSGAEYAGYLGINYSNEFSAAALLGGSWMGGETHQSELYKLLYLQSRSDAQIPFYVALKQGQNTLLQQTELEASKLEKKGYLVQVSQLKEGETFDSQDFKKQLIKWLDVKSEQWEVVAAEDRKTFKEKFRKAVRDFFIVN